MSRRFRHDCEGTLDEVERHVVVEEVAHAIHEDPPGIAPASRQIEEILVER